MIINETSLLEINYLEVKTEIEKILQKYHFKANFKISHEKNEFLFQIKLPKLEDTLFLKLMILAKRHIENWRIHSFEEGFLSLQALNDNLFNTEEILNNLKIRLSIIHTQPVLEIIKKKELNASELSLILEILKLFLNNENSGSPIEKLNMAGCHVYMPEDIDISFKDFGGYNLVKREIKETVILPLLNSTIFESIAKKTRINYETNHPKAVLLSGPPGIGKTTMARIIAKESHSPLVYIPLENIMSSYYGESSKKLALIFDVASEVNRVNTSQNNASQNLILFLDEIDSLAISRNDKIFEATRRILSILLRKIDGIESNSNCITIGATNRKEDIDTALLSRFDTIVEFPYPDKNDIAQILNLYAVHLSWEDKNELSSRLSNLSPRSIKDICKKAERLHAIRLLEENKEDISAPPLSTYLEVSRRNSANLSE